MVGAAVAAAGWRRRTAFATAAGIIAANIPDVDIVTAEAGGFASLALRRGWTHGPPAVLAGALITTGAVLLWARLRRRRRAGHEPVRPGALLALSLIAALTHPLLDWMNTYGIRLLMPFDRSWYYGDALFIIDPWLWLLLGVPLFLIHARSSRAIVAWALLALLLSAVVIGTAFVPLAAKLVWLMGMLAAGVLRLAPGRTRAPSPAITARASIGAAALYIAGMMVASRAAAHEVRGVAEASGIDVHRIMIAPLPARPLHADIVIEDDTFYHFGRYRRLATPRVSLERARSVRRGEFDDVARAAARHPAVRDFLVWSRFPIVDTRRTADGGYLVTIGDARYVRGPGSGTLGGLTVALDAMLRVVAPAGASSGEESATPPAAPRDTAPAARPDDATARLRVALLQMLRGDGSATQSWFSDTTAGALRGAAVDSAGHATVDFHDLSGLIPNASSSAGSALLLDELNATVFGVQEIRSVDYLIDGSCERFWEWLQYGCHTVRR